MSPEVVWRFLADGKVRHAFYGVPSPFTSARCGVGARWWDPDGWKGAATEADVGTLESLRPCKRCLNNLGRDVMPSE